MLLFGDVRELETTLSRQLLIFVNVAQWKKILLIISAGFDSFWLYFVAPYRN